MSHYVPWAITLSLVTAALVTSKIFGANESLSYVGSYVSAVASAIAFVWLVAGFYQQAKELRLQRKELQLQREALELQRQEFRSMARSSALERVESMLKAAEDTAAQHDIDDISSYRDLSTAFMKNLPVMMTVIDANNDTETINEFMKWMKIQTACNSFLESFAAAIRFYARSTGEISPKEQETTALFVFVNDPWVSKVPHFQHYVGTAKNLANHMTMLEPGLDQAALKAYSAMSRVWPGSIKEDALQELRHKVASRNVRNDDPAA